MRVGVSLFQFFPERIGGAGEYIQRVIPLLLPLLGEADELYLFGNSVNLQPFETLAHPRLQRVVWPLSDRQIRWLRAGDLFVPGGLSRSLSRRINALQCDVILCPQQSLFPLGMQAPVVVSVMDLLHERCPEYVSRLQRWLRRRKERLIVRGAAQVSTISEATRADWLRWRDPDPLRSRVIALGGRSPTAPAEQNPAAGPTPYLFYPAHPYPHKNHVGLITAWQRLRERSPDLPGRLILTGQCDRRLAQLLANAPQDITHLGYRSSGEMAAIYSSCRAVVLPTLFEGFGIPLLEGLGYGKPVFCADLPVFRELVGAAVTYFDPRDVAQLSAALEQALSADLVAPAPELQQTLQARFTWNACAQDTWRLLQETAGHTGK